MEPGCSEERERQVTEIISNTTKQHILESLLSWLKQRAEQGYQYRLNATQVRVLYEYLTETSLIAQHLSEELEKTMTRLAEAQAELAERQPRRLRKQK